MSESQTIQTHNLKSSTSLYPVQTKWLSTRVSLNIDGDTYECDTTEKLIGYDGPQRPKDDEGYASGKSGEYWSEYFHVTDSG